MDVHESDLIIYYLKTTLFASISTLLGWFFSLLGSPVNLFAWSLSLSYWFLSHFASSSSLLHLIFTLLTGR